MDPNEQMGTLGRSSLNLHDKIKNILESIELGGIEEESKGEWMSSKGESKRESKQNIFRDLWIKDS